MRLRFLLSRKIPLVTKGNTKSETYIRLPSAISNRPLRFLPHAKTVIRLIVL